MSASGLKVGDYVRIGLCGHVGEVTAFSEGRPCVTGWGQAASDAKITRVIVRDAKPRRKLTLAEGLEWLRLMGSFYLSPAFSSECGPWAVYRRPTHKALEDQRIGDGATPLKAIIAARKALKVKP